MRQNRSRGSTAGLCTHVRACSATFSRASSEDASVTLYPRAPLSDRVTSMQHTAPKGQPGCSHFFVMSSAFTSSNPHKKEGETVGWVRQPQRMGHTRRCTRAPASAAHLAQYAPRHPEKTDTTGSISKRQETAEGTAGTTRTGRRAHMSIATVFGVDILKASHAGCGILPYHIVPFGRGHRKGARGGDAKIECLGFDHPSSGEGKHPQDERRRLPGM